MARQNIFRNSVEVTLGEFCRFNDLHGVDAAHGILARDEEAVPLLEPHDAVDVLDEPTGQRFERGSY